MQRFAVVVVVLVVQREPGRPAGVLFASVILRTSIQLMATSKAECASVHRPRRVYFFHRRFSLLCDNL